MHKVLILGGTGQVGRPLIKLLHQKGWWIRALSRNPAHLPDEVDEKVEGDLLQPASVLPACRGVDVIFSAAGASLDLSVQRGSKGFEEIDHQGNLNALAAARSSGVGKFVYVSVFPAPAINDTAYVQAHARFAAALAESGLPHCVVQPTGFYPAFNSFINMARWGLAPQLGTGKARTNPIHPEDLAEVCFEAITRSEGLVPIGGPIVYTRNEIFELAFNAVHKKPRFIKMPGAVLRMNQALVRWMDPRLADFMEFLSRVAQTDVIAPTYGSRTLDLYFKELAAR